MTTPVYGAQQAYGAGPQVGKAHATVSYVGIGGAILAAIGSALAWVEISMGGSSETLKGTDGDDGMIVIIAAIAAAVLFALGIGLRKAVVSAIGALPGLAVLVFAVLNVADAERLPTQNAEDDGVSSEEITEVLKMVDVSTSFGVYVVLIGGLVAVAAGVMAFLKRSA
ncbi:hypothetical protein [Yinghuangia sp. YIM S09857]|uniref:hypothetical protein n=1 Tax=Yinghuangia sp. YIM S09857 TaxID=3436929 RepID=UPI003F5386E4